jgi:hypothetical protein
LAPRHFNHGTELHGLSSHFLSSTWIFSVS